MCEKRWRGETLELTSGSFYQLEKSGDTNFHTYFWALDILPSTLDILPSTLDILFSTLDILPSTLDILPSTLDILPSTLDKNLLNNCFLFLQDCRPLHQSSLRFCSTFSIVTTEQIFPLYPTCMGIHDNCFAFAWYCTHFCIYRNLIQLPK